jgi:hypothetical protein
MVEMKVIKRIEGVVVGMFTEGYDYSFLSQVQRTSSTLEMEQIAIQHNVFAYSVYIGYTEIVHAKTVS